MEQAPKASEPAKPKSKKTMWAALGVVVIIVVAVLGLYLAGYLTPSSSSAQISILDDNVCTTNSAACKYNPALYNAHVGDKVTWKNNGGVSHTVTFTDASPPTPTDQTVLSGNSVSVTFNTAGAYHYYCTIHTWMKANVTVT